MKEKKKKVNYQMWFYALAFAALFFLALKYDSQASEIATSLRTGWLDAVMLLMTSIYVQGFILLFTTLTTLIGKHKSLVLLWLNLGLTLLISTILKIIIARPRPFEDGIPALASLIQDSFYKWDFSFPSSHTAFAFAALAFVPSKWFWPWVAFSCLIGFSRMYFGLHYLSDVVAGAALGIIVTQIVLKTRINS